MNRRLSRKQGPNRREWFKRKVAELRTELEKLPADRREQLRRELEKGKGR
jgi:hypothetical protein